MQQLLSQMPDALDRRRSMLEGGHRSALRLFNGFSEGAPGLLIDLYATTAVLHNYADPPVSGDSALAAASDLLLRTFPWLECILVKTRNSTDNEERRGLVVVGSEPSDQIEEQGVRYALELRLHQDCSFYLDTRNLREWAQTRLRGRSVLNAFAYTGSLGVAAFAGGASRVMHLDRSRRFLQIARRSYALNGFQVDPSDFICADFFREAGSLRRRSRTFDCVLLDPPFFAASPAGIVDEQAQAGRLINKVRPLVNHGGYLVAVNNALYVSGRAYMQTIQALCADGYLEFVEMIPVPEDVVGLAPGAQTAPITDPRPFNHSTKIAVLRVV
jgi:23S rRNA (cytosine1962-C5)-methyltransferase